MDLAGFHEETKQFTPIQRFYKDCNVFITGASGFLGKILIEKLLRSTSVNTIYILIREKKGKDIHTRVDELLDDPVFQKLKQEVPKYKHKIIAIEGDCLYAGLGLKINDRQLLVKNVNIVFHVAATVKFDENLKLAYTINVTGSKCVLDLCRQMENLKSLIHVSTAYSNCHLDFMEEKFYDYQLKYDDVGRMMDKLTDEELEEKTDQIIGDWPNTYTFTKALAESMIRSEGAGLPVGIFRPAIVCSVYKEPLPGWIDNIYGPTGVSAAVASGLLRTLLCTKDLKANIVPVDTCVAGIIAAAWEVGEQNVQRTLENIKIYNYVSTVENPITWEDYHTLSYQCGLKHPLAQAIWYPNIKTTSNKTVQRINQFLLHTLPAAIVDTLGLLAGHKPRFLKMYKKIHKFSLVLEPFSLTNWEFTNDNVQKLFAKMSEKDRQLFPLSMNDVHWLHYLKIYFLGVRRYIIKESDDTLEYARRKLRRFEILQAVFKYVLSFLAVGLIWHQIFLFLNNRIQAS